MIHSITARITTIVLMAFLLTAAAVLVLADIHLTAIIDASQRAVYEERLNTITRDLARREARLAATGMRRAYEDAFREAAIRDMAQTYGVSGRGCFLFVLDAAGRPLLDTVPEGSGKALARGAGKAGGEFEYHDHDGETRWCVARAFPAWDWTIGYSVPLAEKYADATRFRNRLLVTMAVILALVMGIMFLVINRITGPIRKLTAASRAMAAGDLSREIDVRGHDELASLAASFARMRDAIRGQMDELRRLRNYLQNIINSMPSILVGVDPDGRITQWNLEAEKATGLGAAEVMGRPLDTVMPGLASEMEKVGRAIRERSPQRDTRVPRKDNGATRYTDVTVYPLIANGVEGAVIRVDDITDRVRIEEMMIQTEKMMSVGGLAAGMAHEINNPLAGIMQNLQVLKLYLSMASPKSREIAAECGIRPEDLEAFLARREIPAIIDLVVESGKRAADIVDNMLSFSRKNDRGMVPCDLAALMDQTLELAAKDYDLKKRYDFRLVGIVREYAAGLPEVRCDPGLVQQVFLNILKNGAQAMSAAGTARPEFVIRIAGDSTGVRVEIRDNGPGMDEKTRKRAFEPFFTTKEVGVGTGLGLSVSYFIIVEKHGGRIEVESAPGEGAAFIITLPPAAPEDRDG